MSKPRLLHPLSLTPPDFSFRDLPSDGLAVDRAVIALWLGHESVETTQIYLDANLALKEEMLATTTPPNGKPGRYKADDELLAFLSGL